MSTIKVLNELIKDEARITLMKEYGKNVCLLDHISTITEITNDLQQT